MARQQIAASRHQGDTTPTFSPGPAKPAGTGTPSRGPPRHRLCSPVTQMSGERFDSGGVLSRARPVLTFSTMTSPEASVPARARTDATPPPVSWTDVQSPRRDPCTRALPVVPRIVRRTRIEQHPVLGPIVRAAAAVRRVGFGTLLFAGLGLGTLGVIAGFGMVSLSDEPPAAAIAPEARSFDAMATERLLARAPLAARVERPVPVAYDAPLPQSAPRRPAVVRASPAPSRGNSAGHAVKRHRASSPVARR